MNESNNLNTDISTKIALLDKVRDTLKNPDCWIKFHTAQDRSSNNCKPDDNAFKFCLVGALTKNKAYNFLYEELCRNLPWKFASLTSFNDSISTTHFNILELIDKTRQSLLNQQSLNRIS